MIEVSVSRIIPTITRTQEEVETGDLLNRFNFMLAQNKFYGKIELDYQAGRLNLVRVLETFQPQALNSLLK